MLKTVIFVILLGVALYFLRQYAKGTACSSENRITGQTVIITGANSGCGYETALELAKRGGKIIMACRNVDQCNAAARTVKTESKNNEVFTERLDLSSLKSVKEFAQRFKSAHSRLDVLLLNAGIMATPYTLTSEGLESQFGVNHVGHFALTYLLLDVIRANPSSRIVVVSSIAYRFGNLLSPQPYSMSEADYSRFTAYGRSKLANILFAREATKRWKVTAVSLHPGSFVSNLGRHFPSVIQMIVRPIGSLFLKNNRDGAQTSICCALDRNLAKHNGQFFEETLPKKLDRNPQASNDTLAAELWDWTESFVKKHLTDV